jgi:hypothetical protein
MPGPRRIRPAPDARVAGEAIDAVVSRAYSRRDMRIAIAIFEGAE